MIDAASAVDDMVAAAVAVLRASDEPGMPALMRRLDELGAAARRCITLGVLESAALDFDYSAYGIVSAPPASLLGSRHIPAWLRRRVYERDAYRCQECGSWIDLTVDHIIPLARGGLTVFENLQTLCRPCNSRKSDS